jgi:integrase
MRIVVGNRLVRKLDRKASVVALDYPSERETFLSNADAIRKRTPKLAEAGTISAAYSAHDFRHLYAVTEYRKDLDIYRVSKLLGHASTQVTEDYLRGLGEVD